MTDFSRDVVPPRRRPSNESAGCLGFYCRKFLEPYFTLVDGDGSWPLLWIYWKDRDGAPTFRIFEEKLLGQSLHGRQEESLRLFTAMNPRVGVYVIYEADRLLVPEFPLRVVRLAADLSEDREMEFGRERWDVWLLDGLAPVVPPAFPGCQTWKQLEALLAMPYNPPADMPAGADWGLIDGLLMQLGVAMRKLRTP